MNKIKGFTLIEIMIVTVIIAIIPIIVMSAFFSKNSNKYDNLPAYKFESTIVEVDGQSFIRDCTYEKFGHGYTLKDCKMLGVNNACENR